MRNKAFAKSRGKALVCFCGATPGQIVIGRKVVLLFFSYVDDVAVELDSIALALVVSRQLS
jgi:hypothetical protein